MSDGERLVMYAPMAELRRNEELTPPIASPRDVTEALCAEMAVIFSCRGVRR
ncbi:hypothetical protein ACVMB3_003937 [Sinorhizobium meliloti]